MVHIIIMDRTQATDHTHHMLIQRHILIQIIVQQEIISLGEDTLPLLVVLKGRKALYLLQPRKLAFQQLLRKLLFLKAHQWLMQHQPWQSHKKLQRHLLQNQICKMFLKHQW